MRICLVTHGFPPLERTGVENYTAALAAALAVQGHTVEVFTPRQAADLPNLSMRREERDGYGLTWLTSNAAPSSQEEMLDLPGVAERFGDYLDRERPTVVHFQHLIKLGVGLVEQAQQRNIPALYTAHDYYAVCHRFTLIRPDLSRCDTIGDPAACARCDLALSYLNRLDSLGDYQLGALTGQLPADQTEALAQLLEGNAEECGFTPDEQIAFADRRKQLDRRRLAAYRGFDLILSPTRFLRDQLVRGGLDRDRIEILTYGAETEHVRSVPPVALDTTRPLRFGYLGGLSKHKGVHVLVSAFAQLKEQAELSIWGDSSDTQYVQQVRAQAEAAGVQWRGPYLRHELGACLAEIDVAIVPSIWVENFPFVIREAFAAGRVVIASDLGALPESVRDGVDGLLFEAGNAQALATAMSRMINEDGLLSKLVDGIQPVKGIDTQVGELVPIYERLIAAVKPVPDRRLPASLRQPQRRYQELNALPLRELFRSVMGRLPQVSEMLLGKDNADAVALSVEALASGSHTQTLLRDLRREREWLKNNEASLRKRLAWREGESETIRKENAWQVESLDGERTTTASLAEKNAWLEKEAKNKDSEIRWLKENAAGAASLAEKIAWLEEEANNKDTEINWLKDTAAGAEKELKWLRSDTQAKQAELDRLTVILDEERINVARAQEAASSRKQQLGDAEVQIADAQSKVENFAVEIARLSQEVVDLSQEVAHRRAEMNRAREAAGRRAMRMLTSRTELGRLISNWTDSTDTDEGAPQ